jgi:hypothetical protein
VAELLAAHRFFLISHFSPFTGYPHKKALEVVLFHDLSDRAFFVSLRLQLLYRYVVYGYTESRFNQPCVVA